MNHSPFESCEARSCVFRSFRLCCTDCCAATVAVPASSSSYPAARMRIEYEPASRRSRGKLYRPVASLTTVTVMLESVRFALTNTPSIVPSSCELTTPVRAGDADCAAVRAIAAATSAPRKTTTTAKIPLRSTPHLPISGAYHGAARGSTQAEGRRHDRQSCQPWRLMSAAICEVEKPPLRLYRNNPTKLRWEHLPSRGDSRRAAASGFPRRE